MSIDQIVQNNTRIKEISLEIASGKPDNLNEARKLDDTNYRAYFTELHSYLLKGLGVGNYSAVYFGGNDDFKVAESMPVEWQYFDKSEKYKTRKDKGNIKFEHADLTKGLPESIQSESIDFVLVKWIGYNDQGSLEKSFPTHEALREGGVVASDKPIFDDDERYEKLEFHEDLRLEPFGRYGQKLQKNDPVYWNMEQLHLYKKL